jgi:hypothetical protein
MTSINSQDMQDSENLFVFPKHLQPCDEVGNILNEFISREYEYYYSSSEQRKLFTLEDREDFIRNPKKAHMDIQKYIVHHNLENKWIRLHIRETFNYNQEKNFRKSGLTLDEYIEKYNLFEHMNIDVNDDLISDGINNRHLDDDDEYTELSDDDESTGWGD